jgi:hypothetical protein
VPFRPGSDEYDVMPEAGSDVAPVGGGYEFGLTTAPSYFQDRCPGTLATPPTTACTWDPREPFSWDANREQSVTQLFYFINLFHDHLRDDPDIAFTHGSFERTGLPLGDPNGELNPATSDPVLAQALDGADSDDWSETTGVVEDGLPGRFYRNNASFLTLPDGLPGLMEVHLFMPKGLNANGTEFNTLFGGYDGANDASVVFHEYAHGLSNRLVTDADGYGALNTAQAGAIGEGLSDFYAMDYLEAQGLEQDGSGTADVRVGGYLDNNGNRFRFQPIDCTPTSSSANCPPSSADSGAGGFTYADFGKVFDEGPQVHSDGEIWAQTLWSIRSALISVHGRAAGIARMRRYVTQALRLAPPEPSYLEMRNMILFSAAISGGADVDILWSVFAERGMGWTATTDGSDDPAPSAAFDLPPAATTQEADPIGQTTATLKGVIDPNGNETSYRFEFGETPSYGAATSLGSAGGGGDPLGVATPVGGLKPGTTYHYRVVALRGAMQMAGQDRTFTTAPAPPPAQPAPVPTVTPAPTPGPSSAPRVTALVDTRLSASRTGMFKVTVFFGDAAPAGDARFTVMNRKRKRLARATTPVRVGRTVVKTLRLSKTGRRAIRRGKSKRVTLELRLPSGEKYKKTLRLTRKKR